MAAQRLTDRVEKFTIEPTDLIHIVRPSDTSQNAAGSSYKAQVGLLAAGGGVLRINNTTYPNSADTNKNILDTYDVPANTLTNDGDTLEIVAKFTQADAALPFYNMYVDTPAFSTGKVSQAATNSLFFCQIVRTSATTYTRYDHFITTNGSTRAVTKNIACNFASTFRVEIAIQNSNAACATGIEFSSITLVKKLANANIGSGNIDANIYFIKKSLTAAEVKTLFSVPVDLGIAAPGAGFAIQILTLAAKLNFGTVAFDNNESIRLITDTGTAVQAVTNPITSSLTDIFVLGTISPGSADQIIANKKIYINSEFADATIGDGTIDVYVTYKILEI